MLVQGFLDGLRLFGNPQVWLWMMLGAVVGLIFGIIPGVCALLACSMFLPFAIFLKPEQALPFMVAVQTTVYNGGSITSILLGVPGAGGPSVPVTLDGFPMTVKGESGRALGASLMSSSMGAVYSTVWALLMIPIILPLVMAIASADMVFMILLGMSFIAILSKGSAIKGYMSGALGLLASLIGYMAVTGTPRFTFGQLWLYDGIHVVPVAMGLFAMPILMELVAKGGGGSITKMSSKTYMAGKDVWRGMKDVIGPHKWLNLRTSLIGYVVGIIPGIGSETAVWVAYAHAKQTSKHPEEFGKGNVEGVIGPDSAANSKEGGALMTTLALGIPGSLVMTLTLAAMILTGLTPGPAMMKEHLGLSINLLYVVALAGIIGTILCLPFVKYLAKVAFVPLRILFPVTVAILFVGTFAQDRLFQDLIIMIIFTPIGWALDRFGYSRAAMMLGFIMGTMFERYTFLALQSTGPLFFLRPISLITIAAIIIMLVWGPLKRLVLSALGRKPVEKGVPTT